MNLTPDMRLKAQIDIVISARTTMGYIYIYIGYAFIVAIKLSAIRPQMVYGHNGGYN